MTKVYILHHTRHIDDETEDVKLLGAYSSNESADAAIERFRVLPGFRDAPDGFDIDEYPVDQDCWADGYISWTDAAR